MMKSIYSATA